MVSGIKSMEKNQLTQEKLCTLRAWLPWGTQKVIAERLGKSQEWVNRVLNGHDYSNEVIEIALELYEMEQKRKEVISEKINQL